MNIVQFKGYLPHCYQFLSPYLQAEICLRREKKRLSQYLHSSTEQKLIEVSVNMTFFYLVFILKFLLNEG